MRVFSSNNRPTDTLRLKLLPALIILLVVSHSHAQQAQPSTAREASLADSNSAASLPRLNITASVDRVEAFVTEQILLNVEVLAPSSAFNVRQQKLELAKADVYSLEKTTTVTAYNESTYQRITTRYALFFKQPGNYMLPSLSVGATLPVSAGGQTSKTNPKLSTRSEELMLTIKPAPVSATSWLAATSVTATSLWNVDSGSGEFMAGQPASKRYVVKLSGQLPTAIPLLDIAMPEGIRLYTAPPITQKHHDKSGVRGTLTQVINVIPDGAGEYKMPALIINWWDTENQQWKQTTLPTETIRVNPTAVTNTPPNTGRKILLLLLVVSGIIATSCAVAFRRRSALINHYEGTPLHRFLKPLDVNTGGVKTSEKRAWSTLKKALRSRNSSQVRSATIRWHAAISDSTDIPRLDQIGRNGTELQNRLARLDESIYGHSDNAAVDYSALKTGLTILRRQLRQKTLLTRKIERSLDKATEMKSLYPNRDSTSN